jgi:hypothetical protein
MELNASTAATHICRGAAAHFNHGVAIADQLDIVDGSPDCGPPRVRPREQTKLWSALGQGES